METLYGNRDAKKSVKKSLKNVCFYVSFADEQKVSE